MADTTQNILDLRPPKDSMKAELYRLGLRYTYSTDNGEIWQNDTRGIRATLTNTNQDTTTLEDITTHITQNIALADLRNVTRIDTMTASD
nr:MAG TPA: BNR/Asp-box repeat protein [Caudoviricetes sp.]